MKRFLFVSLVMVGFMGSLKANAEETAPANVEHGFVGADKCGMCHKSDAKGAQYKIWKESGHARAYETLGTDTAKEIAKKAGLEGDPQKSDECLVCHVTAFKADTSLLGEKFRMEDGVQCEHCHGAGADYAKMSVMKDSQAAVANGLVHPTAAVCAGCHNEKAPTWDTAVGFEAQAAWKKIAHYQPGHEGELPAAPGAAPEYKPESAPEPETK